MSKTKYKHSYFVSTLSISLVLFLLGIVAYIGYVVEKTIVAAVDEIEISLLLKEDVKEADYKKIITDVKKNKWVEKASYTSKVQAAEDYKKMTGEDFALFIDDNPLPASIDVTILIGDDITSKDIDKFTDTFSKNKFVEEVLHPKSVVDQVLGYIYKVKFVLYSFFLTLLLISIVLINNAIKLTVRSKRFLIKSMKLIGATDGFIRRPFIFNAARQGILAAFIAMVMSVVVLVGINRGLIQEVITKEELYPIMIIFLFVAIFGVVISVICTSVSLNKQLSQNNHDLHTY